jgi:hypothetical protein
MAYRKVVRNLVVLLNRMGISYAVVGALAAGYYGLPRPTKDVDVLVQPDRKRLKKLVERARKLGFTLVGHPESIDTKNFMLEAREGYRGDFWVAGGWHAAVTLDRRCERRLFGVKVWMAAPEDLILWKLQVRRPKDLLDIVAVMVRQEGKLDVKHMRSWAEKLGVRDVFNELVKRVW